MDSMSNRAAIDSSPNENALMTAGSAAVVFNGTEIASQPKGHPGDAAENSDFQRISWVLLDLHQICSLAEQTVQWLLGFQVSGKLFFLPFSSGICS